MGDRRSRTYRMFQQLDGADVAVHQERCLSVRNRNVVCTRCADACTSGCIALADGLVAVDRAKCVGCGTCATACPTCALEARHPTDAELVRSCAAALESRADGRVEIACACAADALADGTACTPAISAGLPGGDAAAVAPVRVVCLGRVDESLLVGLAAAGAAEVALLHGACATCPQAAGLATVQAVCEATRALLDAWGCPTRVDLVEMPARDAATPASADPAPVVDEPFDQRAPQAGDPATFSPADPEGEAPAQLPRLHVMADGTMPHFVPDRRERLLDALAELGDPADVAVAGRLWARVAIDAERCTSCRLCTVFCPTGALARVGEVPGSPQAVATPAAHRAPRPTRTGASEGVGAGFSGAAHRPADCVRCGACEQVCPRDALHLEDGVRAADLLSGAVMPLPMRPVRVQKGGAHSMLNAMRDLLGFKDLYER